MALFQPVSLRSGRRAAIRTAAGQYPVLAMFRSHTQVAGLKPDGCQGA